MMMNGSFRVSRFYDDELNDLIECMYEGIYLFIFINGLNAMTHETCQRM